jgi:hypothetical protein
MDVKAYLLELGYSQEDATTLAADDKMSKAITTAASRYEEGKNALSQAEQARSAAETQQRELQEWWSKTAQPAILAADGGTAAARAEAARYQAYIKSLKESGYDIPAEMLSTTTVPTPAPAPNPTNNFDPRQAAIEMARQTALMNDLGEEYRELYGTAIPGGISAILDEAITAGKPLRDHVRAKFNFDGKRQELAAKKEADRVSAITKDIEQRLEAKYAERSNPNLAPAVVSKAAAVAEANKDNADSWKTRDGRREAKMDRLSKYKGLKIA